MNVLIDTSVWVDYFRTGEKTKCLDFLIDENLISTNNLILAELIPFLKIKNEKSLIELLEQMRNFEIHIDWSGIIDLQTICLKNGMNGVGIPDLIIAQNAIQHKMPIYSLDTHFKKMASKIHLKVFDEQAILF